MRLVALVKDASSIARFLRNLGEPTEPPPMAPGVVLAETTSTHSSFPGKRPCVARAGSSRSRRHLRCNATPGILRTVPRTAKPEFRATIRFLGLTSGGELRLAGTATGAATADEVDASAEERPRVTIRNVERAA